MMTDRIGTNRLTKPNAMTQCGQQFMNRVWGTSYRPLHNSTQQLDISKLSSECRHYVGQCSVNSQFGRCEFVAHGHIPTAWSTIPIALESTDPVFDWVVCNSEFEKKFEELFNDWRMDTMFVSSSTEKTLHKSFQRIIGLGPDAVPLLLEKLRIGPVHVFNALVAITGDEPVPEKYVGNVEMMRKYWLEWGMLRGLIRDCQIPNRDVVSNAYDNWIRDPQSV